MSQASKEVSSVYDEYESVMSAALKEDEVQQDHRSCMDFLQSNMESIKERLYENELLLKTTKKSLATVSGTSIKPDSIELPKHYHNRITDLVDSMIKSSKENVITDKSLMKNFSKFHVLIDETVNDLQKMAQLKGADVQPVSDTSEYARILSSMRTERNGSELKDQNVARIIKRLESLQNNNQTFLEAVSNYPLKENADRSD